MDIVFSFDGSTIPSGIGNTRKLWNVNSLEDVLYATPSPLFCLLEHISQVLRFSRFNSSSNPLILTFTFSSPFIFSKTRISEATSRIFFPFRIDSNSFNRSGGGRRRRRRRRWFHGHLRQADTGSWCEDRASGALLAPKRSNREPSPIPGDAGRRFCLSLTLTLTTIVDVVAISLVVVIFYTNCQSRRMDLSATVFQSNESTNTDALR